MNLRFTSEGRRFSIELSRDVDRAMRSLLDVFSHAGATEIDDGYVVDAKALRDGFMEVRRRIRKADAELAFIYTTRLRFPVTGVIEEDSGGIHGFHINGQVCSLDAGYNECVLTRWISRPDGTGDIVEQVDVRNKEYVDTDDWGRIYIGRKKSRSDLEKWIERVMRKLNNMEGRITVEVA